MFRNLTIYRFPVSTAVAINELLQRDPRHDAVAEPEDYSLQARLAELAAKPCGAMEMCSRGWVSPYGRGFDAMTQQVGARVMLSLGGEDKILPASVIAKAVEDKADEIEKRTGSRPSGRARRRIRDEVTVDMLPRALVKPYRLNAYLDLGRGLLVVDTSSRKAGDEFVSHLRQALSTFPALPLNAEVAPRSVLTGWIAGDAMPGEMSLGESAELRDPADRGSIVRLTNHELLGDEVTRHLEAGKQCTRLAINVSDRVSCVVGEDLVIRKFAMLDAAMADLGDEAMDIAAELDARFTLLGGEVGALFDTLAEALTLSKVEG